MIDFETFMCDADELTPNLRKWVDEGWTLHSWNVIPTSGREGLSGVPTAVVIMFKPDVATETPADAPKEEGMAMKG